MLKESTPHILSYIVMGSLCAGFFLGIVPSEAFVPIAAAITVFWFESGKVEKVMEILMQNKKLAEGQPKAQFLYCTHCRRLSWFIEENEVLTCARCGRDFKPEETN